MLIIHVKQKLFRHDSPQFIASDMWPPNCPDINSADYCIWEWHRNESTKRQLALVTILPYWIRTLDLVMKTRQYLLQQITMAMQGNTYRPRVKEDSLRINWNICEFLLPFHSANSRWYHLTLRTISFGTITYYYKQHIRLTVGEVLS